MKTFYLLAIFGYILLLIFVKPTEDESNFVELIYYSLVVIYAFSEMVEIIQGNIHYPKEKTHMLISIAYFLKTVCHLFENQFDVLHFIAYALLCIAYFLALISKWKKR